VLIPRGNYYQTGLLIRKGSFDQVKSLGIHAFQDKLRRIAPFLSERVDELKDWDDIKLLSVQINRLRKWHRPGLLCIGDAAHAMSPAGGVGINLAIQDAVATANLLTASLLRRRVTEADLACVQRRREFPTKATQAAQAMVHRQFAKMFNNSGPAKAPWQLKVIFQIPGIQRALARGVGMGVQPEHVESLGAPRKNGMTLKRAAIAAGLLAAGAVLTMRLLTRRRFVTS